MLSTTTNLLLALWLFFYSSFFKINVYSSPTKLELEVKVTGINSDSGPVLLALYNAADGFPNVPDKAYRKLKALPREGLAKFVIGNLPEGNYAISVFHDANGNGIIDIGTFGIPKEQYGVSNNVSNIFGPPSFQKAAIKIEKPATNIEIKLR